MVNCKAASTEVTTTLQLPSRILPSTASRLCSYSAEELSAILNRRSRIGYKATAEGSQSWAISSESFVAEASSGVITSTGFPPRFSIPEMSIALSEPETPAAKIGISKLRPRAESTCRNCGTLSRKFCNIRTPPQKVLTLLQKKGGIKKRSGGKIRPFSVKFIHRFVEFSADHKFCGLEGIFIHSLKGF